MRALLLCRTTVGLSVVCERYGVKRLPTILRLAGAGYRVLARSTAHLSSRWERIRVFCTRPVRPSPIEFEWWLGGGRPLCPYLIGKLVQRLLVRVRPKDVRLPSSRPEVPNGLLSEMES